MMSPFNDKKITYVDMDGTLCNYDEAYTSAKLDHPEITYPQSMTGFFLGLKPIEGAIECYKLLEATKLFEVFILTAPSVMNPHCYTEKRLWVEKHLGMEAARRTIISDFKGLNRGDYLIDDQLSGRGQEYFEGEILHFGSDRFPNWLAVKEHLQNTSLTTLAA